MSLTEKNNIGIHLRDEVCPYLGTRWNASIYYTAPDPENRCYAQKQPYHVHFFKHYCGHWVDLSYQRDNCFSDFELCSHYRGR